MAGGVTVLEVAGSWREVGGLETNCSAGEFLSGVDVWIRRPQVVNKRLLGAVSFTELKGKEREGGETSQQPQPREGMANHTLIRELLPRAKIASPKREAITTKQDGVGVSVTFDPMRGDVIARGSGSYMLEHNSGDPSRVTLCIFTSLRGNAGDEDDDGEESNDLLSPKESISRVTCGPGPDGVSTPMSECAPDGVFTPTAEWLYSVLLPKVVQWSEESRRGDRLPQHQSLVPLDRYCSLYRQLKDKYGPPLIKNWPEATDPHKFVYEDIAIATYLILLWEGERDELALTEKQTFIDLGCGNGLLVYLLSSEGHTGKGIDLRRRKIWSYYGNRVDLEVCSLTPSDVTVFPEYDWLIGNHSDELTPWIPLMAARSAYHVRYFVLPCCPHDFESKFRRASTTQSQYRSYLAYIRQIGETVGFRVQEDTLRIPSSKRVCQIGSKRWYSIEQEEEMEEKRRSFLRERCRNVSDGRGRGGGVASRGQGVVGGEVEEEEIQKSPSSRMGQVDTEEGGVGGHGGEEGGMGGHGGEKGGMGGHGGEEGGVVGEGREEEEVCTSESGEAVTSQHQCKPRKFDGTNDQGSPLRGSGSCAWSDSFLPRSAIEQTRNCSHVDRSLQHFIVEKLARVLLATENWIEVTNCDQTSAKTSRPPPTPNGTVLHTHRGTGSTSQCAAHHGREGGRDDVLGRFPLVEAATPGRDDASCSQIWGSPVKKLWNLGGCMRVSEAVLLFDSSSLKHLKQECGGLQTLLRNHHQVFRVCGGFVQLRNWADPSQHGPRKPAKQRSASDATRLVKTKLCWFDSRHPQGCPWPQQQCPYAHGSSELRDRPDFHAVASTF